MSDNYQAIYDAVRSRISGGNIGDAVERCIREAFDISWVKASVQEAMISAAHEAERPSVLFRPELTADGDQWCALYGPDLAIGVAGFGATPDAAMRAFDTAWWRGKTPDAARAASTGGA